MLVTTFGRGAVDGGTNRLNSATCPPLSTTHELCDQCRRFVHDLQKAFWRFVEIIWNKSTKRCQGFQKDYDLVFAIFLGFSAIHSPDICVFLAPIFYAF